MFKPLLRVLPALSGNVTISCVLNEFEEVDENKFSCYARTAKLLPLSSNLFKRNINISLLNSTYDWDLYKFYRFYSNYFWKSWFVFNQQDLPKYDKYNVNPNRDLDFEFGCKRLSYQEFNKQFSFFAPIYIESVNDIPDYFELDINLTASKTYKVTKTIRVNLANSPISKNYLFNYIYNYASKIDDNVLFFRVEDKECIYYGIDVQHGGFVKATDNVVSKLFMKQNTIHNFDNVICKGFERNGVVLKQVLPLSFSFNVNDLLSETELEKYRNAELFITGKWVKDNNLVGFYDWHYDYTRFFQAVKRINNQTGLLDYVYPKGIKKQTSGALGIPTQSKSASIGVPTILTKTNKETNESVQYILNGTSALPIKKNKSLNTVSLSGAIGVDSQYDKVDVSEFLNIMDMGSPSLREARYKKYKFYNKISPNYSRWKLKYSDDNNPYITNFSPAFSQINNGVYGEYPQKFYDISGIVRKQYNAYYNLILPVGEQGKEIYRTINFGLFEKYNNTINKFCSSWFEMINLTGENAIETCILNNPSFKDVKDNRCYFNGILYNFENIYNVYKNAEKIDKFGVFMTVDFTPINPATINDQYFANYVIYKERGKYIKTPNTFIYDKFLSDKHIFLFPNISTAHVSDEFDQNVAFMRNEDNIGDFINLMDLGLDYYDLNKFFKWSDIKKYVTFSNNDILNKYLVNKFEKLPIFKASNLINKETKSTNLNFKNISDLYYSVLYNSSINKITTNSKINLIESPHTKNSITMYQENTFISSYDLHYLNDARYVIFEEPITDIENKEDNYIWNPAIKDESGEHEITTNCFEKLSGKLSKFYGNEIPEKYKDIDNDVLYIDPYNYNNIVRHYNTTWLKYKDEKLNLIKSDKQDSFERLEHFGKFLNKEHLMYYLKFIYDDPDASNSRKWFSYENIYIRKRIFKYNFNTEENIDIDDIYIPFSEYFILKENMSKFEYDELLESISNVFVYDDVNKVFRFNKIKTYNNKFIKFNFNAEINGSDALKYTIDENAIDYYDKIQRKRTSLSSEVDGNKFTFDLCFKKEFIKINEEIWRLINIEEDFYGAPYKDLYIYEFEHKDDFNQNHNIYEQSNNNYKKWKSNSLECLKPLFFNIFLEEKENTKIFAEYNLYNIFPVNVLNENKVITNTFYRRNANNLICMYDLTQFQMLKSYTFNEHIDDSFIKIGNKFYMYEPAFRYYDELGYLTDHNTYTYFTRTFDPFNHNVAKVENAHMIESYLYVKDYNDIYGTNDVKTVKYYNENSYNMLVKRKGMEPSEGVKHEAVKVIDPLTLSDVYKVTTTKQVKFIEKREPIYAYGYTYTFFDDLGLFDDFGISTYKYIDEETDTVVNYGFITVNNSFNNTATALNLIGETGESVKCISYINNKNIITNKDYIYSVYKQIIPFVRNNAFNELTKTCSNIISFPKRLEFIKNYSFKSPDNIIFNGDEVKKFYLDRYFDHSVPLLTETNTVNNAYLIKYKDTDKSFNFNKYEPIYNETISTINYDGIKIYDLSKRDMNTYTVVYDNEWKHFNSNRYFNLKELIEIDVKKLLSFAELINHQSQETTLEYFKNYCMSSINNDFDDDQILFLFNKYSVQYNHVAEKLTDDLGEKLYRLKYRFILK